MLHTQQDLIIVFPYRVTAVLVRSWKMWMCPEEEQLTEASFTLKSDLKLVMARGRAAHSI